MQNNNMKDINEIYELKERYINGPNRLLNSENRIKSLEAISGNLRKVALTSKDPELLDLAIFYTKIIKSYRQWIRAVLTKTMPKGVVFVVASSNIELLSLYNWGISFLCGNMTIARISRRLKMERIDSIVSIIKDVLQEGFNDVFFQDDESNNMTRALTSICDVRILWGSNKTIEEIRKEYTCSMQEDIAFLGKKSMTLINAGAVIEATHSEKNKLIKNLWNDTLELSFNACSSPHKICVIGGKTEREDSVHELLELLRDKSKKDSITNGFITTNNLLESQLRAITEKEYRAGYKLRGKYMRITSKTDGVDDDISVEVIGVDTLEEVTKIMKKTKPQTLTYFGMRSSELQELVNKENSFMPDRIEKVGNALSFDVVWDGINLFERLSKQVNYDI